MQRRWNKRFTAVDLFCGCGGLSLGLRRAGFNVLAAVDNDELSIETYRMNHRRTYLAEADVRDLDPWALMKLFKLDPGGLDLLAGCPPCQGFSTLRTFNGRRVINEPLNDLVFEFLRFAEVFLPKILMIENVPALMDDPRLGEIRNGLGQLGYQSNAKVFDAVKYGVAQRRRRMILVASRNGCPAFASPINRCRTVAAAIRKMPPPESSDDSAHNYKVRRSERVLSIIRQIPRDGGSRTELSEEIQLKCHKEFDGFNDVYGRMAWHRPAPTITGGCINPSKGRYIHPESHRAITLREAALLQGFPQAYLFSLSKGRYAAAQMVGNAFPPKFAEHHARSLYRHLRMSLDGESSTG